MDKAEALKLAEGIASNYPRMHENDLVKDISEALLTTHANAVREERTDIIALIDSYEIANPLSQYGVDCWEAGAKHLKNAIRLRSEPNV